MGFVVAIIGVRTGDIIISDKDLIRIRAGPRRCR